MITCFLIPGEPKGKARPRVNTATHRAYTPEDTKQYERTVQYSYLSAFPSGQRFHSGSCDVVITAFYSVPVSWPRWKKHKALSGEIAPEKKPDADNIAKAVLDALNGIAYRDDSQVVNLMVSKRYAERGHVTVRIESKEAVQ